MTAVAYPGPDVPAPTPVTIDLPDGWLVAPAPGVAFVAAPVDAPEDGQLGLVVSIRRVDASLTLSEVGSMIVEELVALPPVTVGEPQISGDEGTVTERITRRVAFDAAEEGRFLQFQTLCRAPVSEHTVDVVTVTVTCPLDVGADDLEVVRSIIDSIEVG